MCVCENRGTEQTTKGTLLYSMRWNEKAEGRPFELSWERARWVTAHVSVNDRESARSVDAEATNKGK